LPFSAKSTQFSGYKQINEREGFLMAEKTLNVNNINTVITLFGSFDENARLIERETGVKMFNRDTVLKITGDEQAVDKTARAVTQLLSIIEQGEPVTEQSIRYALSMADDGQEEDIPKLSEDCICISAKGKPIKSKTLGQKKYVKAIAENTVVLSIGPAGTGKTYLAVAMAVKAFRNREVSRIILTRPAVEAGEKLGFLPGDLQTKVDPYLRPLYDALYDMISYEGYQKYVERGSIEVAPLAYMRGRTLDDAFIILDEAQNTTPEQMKMFLTRIGFGSKAVVTGDITQIDLPTGKKSGLKEAVKILQDIEGLEFCYFTEKDVVRHPMVQRIIKAYEKYEGKQEHYESTKQNAAPKRFFKKKSSD